VSVELHVEELVLHGVPAAHGPAVRAAVVAELGRLVAERGLPAGASSTPRLPPAQISVDPAAHPAAAGRAIARALYDAIAAPRRGGAR